MEQLVGQVGRLRAGQGLAEYVLILLLIAIVAVAALTFLGIEINAALSDATNQMFGS